ncbi:MAG TPA: immunoglobulin domain-containing protein [Opitutaceae bacterium]|nr:immunoglobulin domain-containing protein [Opitutaceae bacterium]
MNLSALISRRIHWINFPGAILVALLQRTPVLNVVTTLDEVVVSSPIGAVLKSAVATAAALGAVNSLAGATPLVPSAGTETGITVTAGNSVSVFYTVNGTQTPPMSWAITGQVPPGLDFSGLTGPGMVDAGLLHLEGTPTTAGTYNLTIQTFEFTGGGGVASPIYPYTITVAGGSGATAPSFTTQPASQSVTVGNSVTFTSAASGSPAPTYQWRKDGTNIAGATNTSFTIASVTAGDAGTYTVTATNSAGSAMSNGATLTVTAAAVAPTLTTQPANLTVNAGDAATFTVAADGSPTPAFQWRKDGVNIAGATTATYTIASATTGDAGTYTAVATNSAGSVTSNGATLTVNTVPAAPNIVTQPQNQAVAAGQTATFRVIATGFPAPSYQWQRLPAGSANWENLTDGGSYHGVATPTLSVSGTTPAMSGDQFHCVLTNTLGSATSSAATLTVPGSASALLQYPAGIGEDGTGTFYVADAFSNTIQKITAAGVVSTFAGSSGQAGSQDGVGASARFNQPGGVVVAANGNVYVADTGNATIRKIAPDGTVTTVAGSPANRGNTDGMGTAASFSSPSGIALDAGGNLFVADAMNATVRKIAPDGTVSTVAGLAGNRGDTDGAGTAARFNFPSGVAVDAGGVLYVADTYNDTIRTISPAGMVATLAGSAGISGSSDGAGATALFNQPVNLAVDAAGNLVVADTGNGTIRKVTAAGAVTTIAGMAGIAGWGDSTGGIVLFNQPHSLVLDGGGSIFVADTGNAAVRKVAADGTVTTLPLTPATTTPPPPMGGGTPPPSGMTGGGGGGGAMEPWWVLTVALLGAARAMTRMRPRRLASR